MGNPTVETPTCVRCKDHLVMGHAYELGGDRWHTHCFSCYKCDKPLSCDSNFLVLGTGALICYACSDSCKNCGKKIDDLAIILASSNEAYCQDCFKCCKCGCKIEDLRYAKTKRGLFCIGCHERLLEKRKNYEERKRRLKKQLPLIPPNGSNSDVDTASAVIESTPDLTIPERSMNRPMSPGKETHLVSYKDQSSLHSSPRNHGHHVSSASSLAGPIDFSETNSASGEPPTTSEKHDQTDLTANNSNIHSNSESVVAQFLIDGDYMSTADEESVRGPPVSEVAPEDQDKVASNHVTPKRTHKTNLSIDDMLKNTLDLDNDEVQDAKSLNLLPNQHKKVLLNRTPLRNSHEERINKSPTAYRQGLIFTDEDVVAINSPEMSQDQNRSASPGLGIITPSKSAVVSNENDTMGISYESLPPHNSVPGSAGSQISRSPPPPGHHRRSSSGNAKKLGRSLSMRSKSIMMNLRPKSKDAKGGSWSTAENDLDTHSGWGVAANSFADSPSARERQASKHTSDSTLYQPTRQDGAHHNRSSSGTTGVSIFRTPPLTSQSGFVRNGSLNSKLLDHGALQIDEHDEENDKTPTNDQFFRKDVQEAELTLRRLKLEVSQLRATKAQLLSDVDSLRSSKDSLLDEIELSKAHKKHSATQSTESLEHDNFEDSVERQAATASVATTEKPKFWKLFSASKHAPGHAGGHGKFDISPPVLQNPNEFEDVKLLPVQKDSKGLSSSPPAANDGNSLYGSTLIARCSYEGRDVPVIIDTCIKHIESRKEFLQSDGLYRKSGSNVLIEQIEAAFGQWKPEEPISDKLRLQLNQDIHAVTGVLKRYLRKLPDPVFCFQVYEPLMAFVRERDLVNALPLKGNYVGANKTVFQNAVDQLSSLLRQLPRQHYTLLLVLVRHIEEVSRHSDHNLMNLHNLSLVFTPGLIRDYSGEKDITDMRERNYLVAFVLANHRHLLN
ncbi:LADA_0B03774g1_1 [Lachancea dasiensis]|uniref:LADA_0B03774g1_1 n=1 Tax=Lachancea dasiensis TaxID=1072105 RepID=A0A1G4ISJ3_9SACH|nr:LADA_0B03774g1_1 [Lachancea dasiensis]